MSILVNSESRVCVQGITGREGMTRARLMSGYGTKLVAGVTPGKGGQEVLDVPVYDTMYEAIDATRDEGGIDISVLFIPAPLVKSAAIEAIEAEQSARIDAAEETARNSGLPSLESAYTDVWADGSSTWRN